MENRKYIGTKPVRVISVSEIFSIHYFEYVKNFSGTGEKHNFWELVYVDCGLIEVTAGPRSFPLRQGEVYFHQPDEYHNITSANEFASVFIISFRFKSGEAGFFRGRRLSVGEFEKKLIYMILEESAQTFAGKLDIMDQTQLYPSEGAPYGGEQLIKIFLEHLLISMIRGNRQDAENAFQGAAAPMGMEQHIVDSVIGILTHNLHSKLTLDEICRHIMFSKGYVEKIFRARTGYSLIRYFNQMKTNEAKKLISERRYNLTRIAEMLGFSSLHYFSRVFKSFVGMNPSEYEKSVKSRGLL